MALNINPSLSFNCKNTVNSIPSNYKVAGNVFAISVASDISCWANIAWHYQPFATSDSPADLKIEIAKGDSMSLMGWENVFESNSKERGTILLRVFKNASAGWLFELTHLGDKKPMAWVEISPDYTTAKATIDEDAGIGSQWKVDSVITSSIQIAYLMATTNKSTVLTHSSCVVLDGKAYLFLGKSGTGKSTHSRLWIESIPGASLLNDDHPVIRIEEDNTAIAYGSPWSGKTDCYKNEAAPIGAIVRIKRASHNAIRRLNPIEAYASLSPSLFGLQFDHALSTVRHQTLERIIMETPCYQLECRPDPDAAITCLNGVTMATKTDF